MELVMWIVVGIVAGLGCSVLVPVLVVGTWFVVMTVILGLADGTYGCWIRGGRRNWKLPLLEEYLPSSIWLGEHVDAERVAQVALARP